MADVEEMFIDGEDEEMISAKEVLKELFEAWVNEKQCPELLPHKADLVEIMIVQVEQMEENIKRNPESLSPQEKTFLKEYITLSVNPLKAMCDRMPGPISQLNPRQLEIAPDLETHVFVKSKQDFDEAIIIQDNIRQDEVEIWRIDWLTVFGWLLSAASLSHHIRDGTRRGLWFCPFGSTPPIPYKIYVTLLAILPFIINFLMGLTIKYNVQQTFLV